VGADRRSDCGAGFNFEINATDQPIGLIVIEIRGTAAKEEADAGIRPER
jgi:hypothetical protein